MTKSHRHFRKFLEMNDEEIRPASRWSLRRARRNKFPDELLAFYEFYEPRTMLQGESRLHSISNGLVECKKAIPGIALFRHGYVVFASTYCGDSYCLGPKKINGTRPVDLFSHELVFEDTSLTEIEQYEYIVAPSFDDFLSQFMDGSLSDEIDYKKIGLD